MWTSQIYVHSKPSRNIVKCDISNSKHKTSWWIISSCFSWRNMISSLLAMNAGLEIDKTLLSWLHLRQQTLVRLDLFSRSWVSSKKQNSIRFVMWKCSLLVLHSCCFSEVLECSTCGRRSSRYTSEFKRTSISTKQSISMRLMLWAHRRYSCIAISSESKRDKIEGRYVWFVRVCMWICFKELVRIFWLLLRYEVKKGSNKGISGMRE